MPYPQFNRKKLIHFPLKERHNLVDILKDNIQPNQNLPPIEEKLYDQLKYIASRIISAKQKQAKVMLTFGAHAIKNGLAPVFISLIQNKLVDHLATNGAGIIHDWEFAYQGKSSEDVRQNVKEGRFGMWQETGFFLNVALAVGAFNGEGYGEAIGKMIETDGIEIPSTATLQENVLLTFTNDPERAAAAADLIGLIKKLQIKEGRIYVPHPYKEYSVQAAAYRNNIPFTAHPMFGHDIIYTHPANCGAAIGRTAERDFLSFVHSVSQLSNGIYLSIGSAVMSPMIFEKSMSMARNLAKQNGADIEGHLIVVVDIARSDWNWQKDGEPPKNNPAYYLRYCKSFSRMGGELIYLCMDNRDFLLHLHRLLLDPASDLKLK